MNKALKTGFVALGAFAAYRAQSLPENGRFVPADRSDWWLLIGWSVIGSLVGAALFYAFFRFHLWKQKSGTGWFEQFARTMFEIMFIWTQLGTTTGTVIFAIIHHAYEALFLPGLPTAMFAFAALKSKRDVEIKDS